MDKAISQIRRADRQTALMVVCVFGGLALSCYGLFLIFQQRFPGTGLLLTLSGLAYLGIAFLCRQQPERHKLWRWSAIVLGLTVKTLAAWLRGPTEVNAFFYDGSMIVAAGYALSATAAVVFFVLEMIIQIAAYAAELSLGLQDWEAVRHVAPDTMLSLFIVFVLTYYFRRRHEKLQAESTRAYVHLQRARRRETARNRLLVAANAKAESFATELEETNQALREASEVRARFLANMSHEIRTPMNAVVGMSDMLLTTKLTADQADLASVIQTSSRSLLRVLNDILDVSKLQAGRMEVRPAPSELRPTIQTTVRLFEANAAESGIDLSLEIDPELPAWVMIDAGRVSQILANYLSNAVKFTEAGSVHCRVFAPRPAWLRVEVRDTGVGIAPDKLQRLFLPFEQLDTSTTRRVSGTGLGLSISDQLAGLMGGAVGASSELGRGSTFWVELPAPVCAPQPVERKERVKTADLARLHVLIADDNEVNQRVAVRQLERLGVRPVVVSDGQEALDALEADPGFDVVLMDCQMPRLDGYEATERLRADPRFEGLRVVALTASALEEDVQRSRAAGMDAHLAKPYTLEELRAVLLPPVDPP